MLSETEFEPISLDSVDKKQLTRSISERGVVLYFEAADRTATAFDVPKIQLAREAIHNITNLPDYEKHCVLRYDVNNTALGCAPPFSLLNFFYGRKVVRGDQTLYLPFDANDKMPTELIDAPEKILESMYANGQQNLVDSLVSNDFQEHWYKVSIVICSKRVLFRHLSSKLFFFESLVSFKLCFHLAVRMKNFETLQTMMLLNKRFTTNGLLKIWLPCWQT